MSEQKTIPEEEKNYAWELPYEDEYSFWDGDIDHIDVVQWDFRPMINQWMNTKSKSACTIFGAWNQLIRLFQLNLTLEKANEIWLQIVDYCVKNWGYVVWEWWWVYSACIYVTKWWNEIWFKQFKKEKVFYIRKEWNNPIIYEALSKWHLVWYSKTLSFWQDQRNGYIYRKPEDYKAWTWHRLNLKGVEYTKSTWGAPRWDSKYWGYDNYYWWAWQEFFIKDIAPYINKGINSFMYLILPISYLNMPVDETKEKIAEQKAVDAVIATLTTTWWDLPEWAQKTSADYAKKLREEYEDAKPIIWDQTLKSATSVVDMLSYNYKFMPEKYQQAFAELAKQMRVDFNIK